MRVLLVLVAAVSSMGCLSTSTMGLARTLNKGAVQGWVGLQGGGIVASGTSTGGVNTGATTTGYPMFEGGVRVGASDHVELGARVGLNGIGLEGKFALLRSPTMDTGINLSLAPQVGFFGIGVGGLFVGNVSAQLPVLIGIDLGGHELVFGPRLHNQLFLLGASTSAGSGTVAIDLLSAGASVGFAIKAGPVRLIPEASFLVPFFASGAVSGTQGIATGAGVGGFIFQIGFGFMFGSKDAYERPQPLPMPEQLGNAPLPPSSAPPPMPPPSGDMTPPPPPPPNAP